MTKNLSFLFFIICCFCNCKSDVTKEVADLIVQNGTIVSVDSNFTIYEAIAFKDGEIVAIGNRDDIEHWKDATTQIIDLEGKTVLPGLIEPHTHAVISAVLYQWVDMSGFTNKTSEEAFGKLKTAALKAQPGQWILGFGWDPMLLEDAVAPTKEFLDETISSENPIWVMMQNMHSHYFNSKAFELAGIDKNTPNPHPGSYYDKDKNGELTGLVAEAAALGPFAKVMPKLKEEAAKYMMMSMYEMYNSQGITSIGITGRIDNFIPSAKSIMEAHAASDSPRLRVVDYLAGNSFEGAIQEEKSGEQNPFYRIAGVKYWSDGSPYTGTMLLEEPYLDSELANKTLGIPHQSHGHGMYPFAALEKLFAATHQKGWQLSVHAQGDSATALCVRAYENAINANPRADHRHRLEHLALAKESEIEKMGKLGLTPSFHINHIYYYGDFLQNDIIGEKRANRLMPTGWAKKHGLRFTLHNDSPMYPPKPLLCIRTAVTRMTASGKVLGEDLKISVQDAIKAVTIDAAWQLFLEKEIGSLEIGKRADFVILEDNPLKVNPEKIHEISILATYVEGREVFKK